MLPDRTLRRTCAAALFAALAASPALDLAARAPGAEVAPPAPPPRSTGATSSAVASARAAVAEATRATGTEDPSRAGASFAQPAPRARAARPTTPLPAPPLGATTAGAAGGPWRVQLGAFSVAGNAERLWDELADRRELAGRRRLLVRSGAVVRLQAAGYPTRSAAEAACRSLRQAGRECLVTDR